MVKRPQSRLGQYTNLDVLAIGEVAYLSFESKAADVLFEVVSRRDGETPRISTVNPTFKDCPSLIPGVAFVLALTGRLIHHCYILFIKVESYTQNETIVI